MGNNQSGQNFKDSKPISAFFNEKIIGSTVITKEGFFYFNDQTREHIKNSLSKRSINLVVFDEENNQFITAEDDFFIRIYSGESGQYIRALPNLQSNLTLDVISISHQDFIRVLYPITPMTSNHTQYKTGEDMLLLSGAMDGTVRLWDMDSGNLLAIYVADEDGNSRNGNNRNLNKILDTLQSGITALTFDSLHSYVISGSTDGIIRKYSFIERNVLGVFEGHGRGAILNLLVTRQGHLVSSSMDRTIRLWDIETNKQLNGCMFFAQTMIYDKYRNIIFAASDNGSVALIQIVKENNWVLKKIKVLDLKKPAIIHLHYNTYADLLTVTSIETNIASVQNATGIPFDVVQNEFKNKINLIQGLWDINNTPSNSNRNTLQSTSVSRSQSSYSLSRSQSSMLINSTNSGIPPPPPPPLGQQQQQQYQYEEEEEVEEYELNKPQEELIEDYIFSNEISNDLTNELIELSINELKTIKQSNSYDPNKNESNEKELLDKLNKLKKLGSDLFDSQINQEGEEFIKTRKTKYSNELKQFEDSVEEITEDYKSCMRMLIATRDSEIVLDTENCKLSKQEELEKKKQELLERHKRELEQFEQYSSEELKLFNQDSLQFLNKKIANEYIENKKRLIHSQETIDQSIQSYLSNTFPAISNRYHLGTLISDNSTTVFRGFDCKELRPVAVKVLPPGIKLNVPVHKELITNVYEICETPQSIYVVMEPTETSLKPFIESINVNHQLPIDLVRSIMKQLLETLKFLHSSSLVYRDLNPSRVLINGSGAEEDYVKIKLTHLGIMRSLQGTVDSEPAEDGMIYGAPEIFGRVINTESDIWSLGCIFIYLLQTKEERAKPLFHGHNNKSLIENIVKIVGRPFQKDIDRMINNGNMQNDAIQLLQFAVQLPVPFEDCIDNLKANCSNAPDTALDLLQHMLQFIPDKRITLDEALSHPFITNQIKQQQKQQQQQEMVLDSKNTIIKSESFNEQIKEELEENSNSNKPDESVITKPIESIKEEVIEENKPIEEETKPIEEAKPTEIKTIEEEFKSIEETKPTEIIKEEIKIIEEINSIEEETKPIEKVEEEIKPVEAVEEESKPVEKVEEEIKPIETVKEEEENKTFEEEIKSIEEEENKPYEKEIKIVEAVEEEFRLIEEEIKPVEKVEEENKPFEESMVSPKQSEEIKTVEEPIKEENKPFKEEIKPVEESIEEIPLKNEIEAKVEELMEEVKPIESVLEENKMEEQSIDQVEPIESVKKEKVVDYIKVDDELTSQEKESTEDNVNNENFDNSVSESKEAESIINEENTNNNCRDINNDGNNNNNNSDKTETIEVEEEVEIEIEVEEEIEEEIEVEEEIEEDEE